MRPRMKSSTVDSSKLHRCVYEHMPNQQHSRSVGSIYLKEKCHRARAKSQLRSSIYIDTAAKKRI